MKRRTSPSSRRSLKLRLFIRSCGELGKQKRQFVRVERRSMNICAIGRNEADKRSEVREKSMALRSPMSINPFRFVVANNVVADGR